MGKRGPAPTPTKLKKARGNPGKRALPKNELDFDGGIDKTPPIKLGRFGMKVWRTLTEAFDKIDGFATSVDAFALAQYCQAWEMFVAARTIIEKEGLTCLSLKSGSQYQHPAVGIMNKASERIDRWGKKFGLSPADRAGFELPDGDGADSKDPMSQLLAMMGKRSSN